MGSMKSKRFKAADGAGVSANGGVHKEQPSEVLRARVEELEREARRRDQEAAAKDLHVKVLQEQLTAQTRALAQLSEQLHHKCIQLNKLQGSVKRKTGPGQSGQSDAAVEQSGRSVSPVGESGQVGAAAGLCLGQSVKAMSKLSPNLGCLMKEAMDRRRGAKAGVSAEPSSSCLLREFNFEKARVSKDASVKRQLTEALNRNQYLKRLESQQLKDMVECMYERTYQPGEHVVKQGEPGNHLFVLSDGRLDVFQHGKLITTLALWTTFGELAILCNCTRTASVRAVGAVTTWALDREVFQNIMRTTAETRHEQHRCFLRSVSLLANLPEDKLAKIVDCLEVEEFLYAMMDVPFLPISYHCLMEYYDRGEYVIREGEEGSTFYVISKGKVKVTQSTKLHRDPQTINTLYRGDYFGEKALISDDVRSANIIAQENGVECLVIDRVTFDQTVGTFSELQKYLQGYVATLDHQDQRRHAKKSACARQKSQTLSADQVEVRERTPSSPGPPLSLDSLEVLATLGVGGFGRVELVKVRNEDVTFAMKVIKKQHIVNNRQQEHVHSERKILSEARSPFIVKLHQTFKDSKCVYMLLEACLGGEIWSLLRDRGSFEENTAKFCLACVTEAFDYLHRHGILYRDLKPENLMLDADGYIKLVDFGFAKKIQCGQRTWTFCGTPEYVAPEVILNKGHSFSVDFWSLGILLFELLTGSPPFSGSDQMMTYTFILKGLEKIDFPKKITKRPEDLIRKLCRRNPAERLGNLKNGLTDIKKHRWLSGFNWEGLQHRKLTSPLKRELSGPTDHRYFDSYPPDEEVPPDELSGWDMEF